MKNKYHLFVWLADRFKGFFTRRIFVFVALLQSPVILYAQNNTSPETEIRLKKAAEKYFERGDFMEAYPLYSQLLSLYPRNPNYNYRFGACLLYTHADKNKAVDYLEFSVQHPPVDDLAYYYLGRALHLNYCFNEAVNSYKKFEQIASASELKKYPVDRLIEMCVNGKKLLANLHGLDVLRKKELNFPDYVEAYDMRANGGSLLSEPEAFKTKLDKEKKEPGFIYLTPDKTEAFFSSYGTNENNGKDIYEVKRNSDGSWGAPENLGNIINTDLDEDYPVYDAPRNTLYFCSKGHNSMGGYDIFRSVYNDTYDTWSEPENLDFPINTPDDDILFIPDTSGKTAFFASTRSSPQNMIDVYKIVLHFHPPQSLVVAGTAYTDDGKTPVCYKITVRNIKTNDVVGVYKSSANGKYSFSLPNGGSYNFTIEDSGHKAQSQPVVLPVEETTGAMQQDIKFDSSGALRIKNYPAAGGMPEDSDYRLAYNYLEQQALMDVNVDTNSVQALLAQNTTANPDTNNTAGNGSNNLATDSVRLAQEEQPLNVEATNAIDYAGDKMEQSQQLEARADNILNAQNGNNSAPNTDSIAVAKKLLKQSAVLEEKGIEAYRLAAAYKSDAAAKQSKTTATGNSNPSIVRDTNSAGQMPLNSQTSGNTNSETPAIRVSPGNLIREQAEQLKEDSSEVIHTNDSLNIEVSELQQKSQSFIIQAGQAKDPQEKLALLQQADDLSKSRQVKQEEIKENNVELQQLHDEYTWLNNEAQKTDSVSNNGDTTNLALKQEINEYANADNSDSTSIGNNSNNNPANEVASNNENSNSSDKSNVTNTTSHLKHSHNRKNLRPAANIVVPVASVPTNNNTVASSSPIKNTDTSSVSVPINTNVAASPSPTKNIVTPVASVPANNNTVASSSPIKNTDTSSVSVPINTNVAASPSPTKNIVTPVASVPANNNAVASSQKTNTDTSSVSVPVNTNVAASPSPTKNIVTPVPSAPANNNAVASSQKTNTDTSSVSVPANTNVAASSPIKNTDTLSVSVPTNTNIAASPQATKNIVTPIPSVPDNNNAVASSQKTNTDTSSVSVPVNTNVAASSPIKNTDTLSVSVPANTNVAASSLIKNTDTLSVSVPTNTNIAASSQATKNIVTPVPSVPDNTNAVVSSQKTNTDIRDASAPINTSAVTSSQITKNITITPVPINTSTAASPQKTNTDVSDISAPSKPIANTVIPTSKTSEDIEPSSVSSIQYTDTASVGLNQESQDYFTTATSLAGDAEKTRKEAYSEQDKTKSDILYDRADSLDDSASQLNLKGEETLNEAGYRQYRANLNKLAAIGAQPVKNQSDSADSYQERDSAAQKMLASADADYRKSVIESDSANNNTDLAVKRTYMEAAKKDLAAAILQQQSAIYIYAKSDSEQTANAPAKLNSDSNIQFANSNLKTENEKTTNIPNEVHTSLYSASNPIPIDPSLPTGVIFKVQVGAFRKPIPQDLFQGIEPVIGLSSLDGLIRYSVGLFSSLTPAEDALSKIRNDGYTGAFIVAFYNGKRITIKEALSKLGITPAVVAASENLQANSTGETGISSQSIAMDEDTIIPSKKALIEKRRRARRAIKDTVPPDAQSFTDIKGLVFTVQVGSFSKHKGFIRLRKIKHLYYWTDKNGTVKYNSGIYGSIADAIAARNIIVANTPVKDAFVSAYYNGERITIKQAKDLLNGGNTHHKQ